MREYDFFRNHKLFVYGGTIAFVMNIPLRTYEAKVSDRLQEKRENTTNSMKSRMKNIRLERYKW